ncbi:hypothetical protein EDC17_102331 [Sphingobacterium alimentarium]|uniref:Uncharacterized protein n=1 Tax=Sphingobacterium alimentarium TaxID=797292 RepID=A0A4R3VXI9_9SPHI|nr:hypothetical protein EDC17_102331 [Sphingobacterium alimentarium]
MSYNDCKHPQFNLLPDWLYNLLMWLLGIGIFTTFVDMFMG